MKRDLSIHIGIVSIISAEYLSNYLNLEGNQLKVVGPSGATAPTLLVEELIKRGYKVSVFSVTPELEPGDTYTVKGNLLTLYFGGARKRVKHQILDFYKIERKFLRTKILEVRPSILHAHWQYEYSLGALDTKIPVLITCRDSPVHVLRYLPNGFRLLRLIIALYVVNKAKYLSATSNYLAKNIKLLCFNKSIRIISNFEPDWIFSLYQNKRLYSPVPKLVMINHYFEKRKNVEVGIEAFQILRKQYPAATLHLYGIEFGVNGPAHQWVLSKHFEENIQFCGVVDFTALMHAISDFNILVHTAREETFGNILAEAMAQGIPVVGGEKSGAVPEVIGKNGKAGYLVDINSSEKVAEAILKILRTREVYNEFSRNARDEALKKFKPEDTVVAYEKLYVEILKEL